jgi:hypothetical protein
LEYGDFKCPWIEKETLWQEVEKIRARYWPEGIVPVDIEVIVEFRLKLDIEPIHDLQSQLDMDAYLKVDRSGIVVDYDSYMNLKLTNRLRFSFAHEVGHYFLHSDIYAQLDIKTPEDWKEFTNNLPESEYANFEWQANEFAGRLLVPCYTLKSEVSKVYEIIQYDADLKDYLNMDHDAVLSRVAPSMRRKFGVSEDVIKKRVQREGLWPPRNL